MRVHDACFTSEVLGSLKCDCREQLALALEVIQAQPPGMVIYLQQEGRGIGLANKIAAYALQEKGLDTVDANRALGLPDDCREYSAVRHILEDLGVKSIRLMVRPDRQRSPFAEYMHWGRVLRNARGGHWRAPRSSSLQYYSFSVLHRATAHAPPARTLPCRPTTRAKSRSSAA